MNTQKNLLDDFYPMSETMTAVPRGLWQVGMQMKLINHLSAAKSGNRDSESRLINRIGQLRRNLATFDLMSEDLKDVFKEAVDWLRSIGRTVDFSQEDPRFWITARDGKSPRW